MRFKADDSKKKQQKIIFLLNEIVLKGIRRKRSFKEDFQYRGKQKENKNRVHPFCKNRRSENEGSEGDKEEEKKKNL
jgi:hypothetical protein